MVEEKLHKGIDEISMRMQGRAYNTLIQMKLSQNFPMYKVGGTWQAYEQDILVWLQVVREGRYLEDVDIPSKQRKRRGRKPKKEE